MSAYFPKNSVPVTRPHLRQVEHEALGRSVATYRIVVDDDRDVAFAIDNARGDPTNLEVGE
jgi:hypothetical protein